jgi:hypothetical protein
MGSSIWKWVVDNRQWIFEGIGAAAIIGILGILRYLYKRRYSESPHHHDPTSSTNQQLRQGNIEINVNPTFNNNSEQKMLHRQNL